MSENIEKHGENKNRKSHGFLKIIIVIILTAIITYFITVRVTINTYINGSGMSKFNAKASVIKALLNNMYIKDYDEEKMLEMALKGYVQGVGDKYTQYLDKDEMQSLTDSISGNYVGIGVYLISNPNTNQVMVAALLEDGAAEKAGIQPGDIIKAVDGVEYKGEDIDTVSKIFKGEEGKSVKVTVLRAGKELNFDIVRASIKLKSVKSKMIDNVAYIQINSFAEETANDFKNAYNELKKNNPKGLVIDLRNNGGGLVSSALAIAENMVEKGETLLITKNSKNKEEITKSKQNPIIDIPVVVVINENSASASEILAGILKDDCNYKIVGKKSYGKGVIQGLQSFTDGSGVKITMEEYFTPKHEEINNKGITPDIEVDVNSEYKSVSNIPYEKDLQLQKAIEILK